MKARAYWHTDKHALSLPLSLSHRYPFQTAALTLDKPTLAASVSEETQLFCDPAPDLSVNMGLTLFDFGIQG